MRKAQDTTIDANIARKNALVDADLSFAGGVPLFSVVEVNLSNTCTRKCDFCPISYEEYKPVKAYMPDDILKALIASLKNIAYKGMIIFSGFCEPLLRKSLVEDIAHIRRELSGVRIEIITNGDLLTADIASKLYSAGLSTLCVSVYDGPEQFEKFENFRLKHGFSGTQMILRRRFYENQNYGFVFTNRAGCIKSDKYGAILPEDFPLRRGCNYPFYYTFVDVDGTVLSCPHDWFRQSCMGVIGEQELIEIWRGAQLQQLRMQLLANNRSARQCCKCSTDGLVMGAQHVAAWKNCQLVRASGGYV